MKHRLAVLLPVAAALFGLAACANSTTGQGSPAPTTSADQSGQPSSGPTSGGGSTGGGPSLASVDPCKLLSSSVLTEYGLSQAQPASGTGARPCSWQKPVDINGQNGLAVEIDVRDSQGVKDINSAGYTVTTDNVGNHQGKQLQLNAGGSCLVVIGVSDSSRVDVGVTAGTDTTQACQVANQLAKVVEPQLPTGG